tara:strand:+ start:5718 stop:7145 length:1428 start_codon:yes stop_codon:yes gene_type:complete
MATWKKVIVSGSAAELSSVTLDTQLAVAQGGTGATTLTDGGVLLGSGTGAITALGVLSDGQMIVGDGTTDPVAESGATLRTSIGVGTGDSPTFTGLTLSGDLEVQGGDITLTNGATDIDLIDNNANALSIDATGAEGLIRIDTQNSSEAVHMSKALNVVGAISGSSTAEFASLTLDTQLAVAEGGTNATALTDKAVLISQDSGTDTVNSLALTGNGEIVVGGSSGPAVEAAADVAGTGLDASVGDGTLAINVAAAQTSITSLINSSLTKIGTAADQEYIKFDTSNEVNVHINNTERFSVTATGADLTGNLSVSGDVDLTGAATDIDLVDNNASALSFDATGKAGILEIDTSNSAEGVKMSGDLTVEGNFVVNGDTTQANVANLLVQDRFLLLNSGSATGDGGLIVQTESAFSGSAFVYDDSESRFGFQIGTKLGSSAVASVPDAHVSSVVTSDLSTYRKNGNIRVQSGDIYIYVE